MKYGIIMVSKQSSPFHWEGSASVQTQLLLSTDGGFMFDAKRLQMSREAVFV